jgi:hypothetical protein
MLAAGKVDTKVVERRPKPKPATIWLENYDGLACHNLKGDIIVLFGGVEAEMAAGTPK